MRKCLLAASAVFIASPALAQEAAAPPLTPEERAQAAQELQELRARSPHRWLRVNVRVEPHWVDAAQATIGSLGERETRLRLMPGSDPGRVLDDVRRHARVDEFAVESPTLSELFLEAAGPDALRADADLAAGGPA